MKDQEEKKSARRELLGSGALAAAGVLFAGFAAACGDDGDEKPVTGVDGGVDGGNRPLDGGADAATPLDASVGTPEVQALNTLLKAEYNAIKAYTAGGPLVMGAATTDPLYALRTTIVAIATNIAGQHTLHAAALVDAITAEGGTPVSADSVTFTPPPGLAANLTITNILKFAAGAERAAAVAYNKTIAQLGEAKHRFLATAIEGDESQHFIILAALVLGLASPGDNLNDAAGKNIPPRAFVRTVGTKAGQTGLETDDASLNLVKNFA